MSIPNEALQKLLQEIEQKNTQAQQQISLVKAQIAAKNREKRLVQLTVAELNSLPAETPVYDGVGKMFAKTTVPAVKTRLEAQVTSIDSDTSNIEKRLHYLETTAKNSRSHIDQLLNSK